jgi:hypothetical protein
MTFSTTPPPVYQPPQGNQPPTGCPPPEWQRPEPVTAKGVQQSTFIRKLGVAALLAAATLIPVIMASAAQATAKQTTYVYAAATRTGYAVYVHALVKVGPTQVRNGNRLLYLQRYLGGQWQNMLTRRTLANGQATVGFVQKGDYAYRWVAPEVGYAAWGASTQVHAPLLPTPPFTDGTYRVNVQIPPGLYYTPGNGGCYWARLSDLSGSLESIITNNFFLGSGQVQVSPTDVGFEVTGGCIWRRA